MQREKGWKLTDVYEDGGYSAKDLDCPAMQRLLYHVRQGNIDVVDVVIAYKLDRISRSLKDFYGFWQVLKDHGVTLVSATQNFDTSDSAGNLMLNILLSFAQYERELTMERTATNKYYNVNIKLHQIPELAAFVNHSDESSDNERLGSPGPPKIRTFWPVS